MKKFLFVSLILSIFCLVGCVKITQLQAPNLNQAPKPEANLIVLNSQVLEKSSKEPIAGAIVYIGTGSWQCQTNNLGQCTISGKQFVSGDYAVSVYKKGYQRLTIQKNFSAGANALTLEIEPTTLPETLTLTGTVMKNCIAGGRYIEICQFHFVTENKEDYYIFNNIGYSLGFESYKWKKVTITGYKAKGFIDRQGWSEVEGIYVEEIK